MGWDFFITVKDADYIYTFCRTEEMKFFVIAMNVFFQGGGDMALDNHSPINEYTSVAW